MLTCYRASPVQQEWKEFLHWRHEYLVEKSQAQFTERRAEIEQVRSDMPPLAMDS
jgi:hypothetical protein